MRQRDQVAAICGNSCTHVGVRAVGSIVKRRDKNGSLLYQARIRKRGYPAQCPTPAALRWMIFTNRDGFDRCVVRRGRRVLIDEAEYFRWLDETSQRWKQQQ